MCNSLLSLFSGGIETIYQIHFVMCLWFYYVLIVVTAGQNISEKSLNKYLFLIITTRGKGSLTWTGPLRVCPNCIRRTSSVYQVFDYSSWASVRTLCLGHQFTFALTAARPWSLLHLSNVMSPALLKQMFIPILLVVCHRSAFWPWRAACVLFTCKGLKFKVFTF